MVRKHVFVLFFQGEQLRVRVRKICEGWVNVWYVHKYICTVCIINIKKNACLKKYKYKTLCMFWYHLARQGWGIANPIHLWYKHKTSVFLSLMKCAESETQRIFYIKMICCLSVYPSIHLHFFLFSLHHDNSVISESNDTGPAQKW